jgi:hypothetical protein
MITGFNNFYIYLGRILHQILNLPFRIIAYIRDLNSIELCRWRFCSSAMLTLSVLMLYIYIYIYIYMELLVKPEILTSYIYMDLCLATLKAVSFYVLYMHCFNFE